MIPADKIYHILEDLKKLRQERGYTRIKFKSMREEMQPLVDKYHWHKDEFLDLVVRKGKILGYKNIKKELQILNSLLDYIEKMLKKKEFVEVLVAQKIDIEQFKKAIKFNMLKLKILKDLNKECRKKMKKFITFIRVGADKDEFKKALAEWDEAQSKLANIDRLENSLEKKVMVEQTKKFPKNVKQRTGMWKTATAYAMAAMIGFGAITGSYTSKEGISFGGGAAMAGELHDKAFYDGLAEKAEDMNDVKNYKDVIKLLDKYKNVTNSAFLLNELARAYGKSGNIDYAINLFEQGIKLNPHYTATYYNLGGIYGYVKKDKAKGIKFFKLSIQYANKNDSHIKNAQKHIKKLSK